MENFNMKNVYHLFFSSFLIFIQMVSITFAQRESIESSLEIMSLPDGVSVYQLDNGLEVLLIENPGLPMIGVNLVVKTGSAYETFSTSGMSHMLEHLLFNGTESRSQKELYDAVDLIGGYNNANTGTYYTNYMMVTPAENIKRGMEIQADMLFHSVLPEEKFEKEKGIVLEEIARSLENEASQMERNINSILYRGHALSLPTLGTYSTIESMHRDDVYAYYKNNYVPNNMIMSVVGNFKTDSMLVLIKKIYGKEKPNLVNRPSFTGWSVGFYIPEERSDKSGNVYQRFYKGDKEVLQLFYPLPTDWTATHYNIFDEILSKTKSELSNKLSQKYPEIASSIEMETIQSPIKSFLKVSTITEDEEKLNELTNAINLEIKKLKFQLPEESIKFLATAQKTTFLKNVEKPHMFGIYNAHLFAEGGIRAVLTSYSTSAYIPAALDISTYFIWEDPVIILQTPEIKGEAQGQVKIKRAQLFVDDSSDLTLIAEENPKSELLAIHFLLKHKAQYESQTGKDAAKILHDCLGQRLNSVENQKISNQYGLTYKVNDNPFIPMDNIYLDPDFSYIRVEGLADDVKGVISYLKGQLTNFQPTEDEYQKATAKISRPMMGMGSSKASELFTNTYKSYIYESDQFTENTKTVSYEDLNRLAKNYFHPSNMIISVVSPLSADSIRALFQWNTNPPPNNFLIEKAPVTSALKMTSKPVKEELEQGGERSFLFWGFVNKVEDKDKPALKALDLLLSDRIIFDIREKQGRAYRMQAGADVIGNHALFYINMGTRAANIDTLLPQIPGFFTEKVVEAFSENDLKKSLNMYLGRMMFRRLSSINRAYYLGHSQYFHNDINYDAEFHQALKNVSLENVQSVARKYMIIKNPVAVIVR
jgi:predicted Zn-dependent peptidase